jgi:hypothetical protein
LCMDYVSQKGANRSNPGPLLPITLQTMVHYATHMPPLPLFRSDYVDLG